jgi:3-phenylpropionate/cinnamic acid dioxygenase small subunit
MKDEEQIRSLVIAYAERLDAGDLDGVAALFERGEFRSARGGPPRVGAAAVRSMYEPVVIYDDGAPRTKHVLGNIEVECDRDQGSARAACTFVVMQAAPDGPLQATLAGRYHDHFTYADERWWFTERVVHPDLMGDLSAHMRRA